MLIWIGIYGHVCQWLFYDREIQYKTEGQQINLDNPGYIGTILSEQRKEITLVAEDLTENEYDYVSSISRAGLVWRVYKDFTTERLSIKNLDFNHNKSDRRREFIIILNEQNKRVAR